MKVVAGSIGLEPKTRKAHVNKLWSTRIQTVSGPKVGYAGRLRRRPARYGQHGLLLRLRTNGLCSDEHFSRDMKLNV